MSDQVLAVIPARYGSTRFPGKPLEARVENLWTGQTSDADGVIAVELRDHACALFRLT